MYFALRVLSGPNCITSYTLHLRDTWNSNTYYNFNTAKLQQQYRTLQLILVGSPIIDECVTNFPMELYSLY